MRYELILFGKVWMVILIVLDIWWVVHTVKDVIKCNKYWIHPLMHLNAWSYGCILLHICIIFVTSLFTWIESL